MSIRESEAGEGPAQPLPGDPYEFGRVGYPVGSSVVEMPVSVPTREGEALVLAAGIGGGTANIAEVRDTRGNPWRHARSSAVQSPRLVVWVATGDTHPLGDGDRVTITLDPESTAAQGMLATACPGVELLDVDVTAANTNTTPSVTGTPGDAGQTAVASFTWPGAGGEGELQPPFTRTGQIVNGGARTTMTHSLDPPAGAPLTAGYVIVSAAWRAVLLTFRPRAGAVVRVWDGAGWVAGRARGWDGAGWAPARAWTGAAWVPLG